MVFEPFPICQPPFWSGSSRTGCSIPVTVSLMSQTDVLPSFYSYLLIFCWCMPDYISYSRYIIALGAMFSLFLPWPVSPFQCCCIPGFGPPPNVPTFFDPRCMCGFAFCFIKMSPHYQMMYSSVYILVMFTLTTFWQGITNSKFHNCLLAQQLVPWSKSMDTCL